MTNYFVRIAQAMARTADSYEAIKQTEAVPSVLERWRL